MMWRRVVCGAIDMVVVLPECLQTGHLYLFLKTIFRTQMTETIACETSTPLFMIPLFETNYFTLQYYTSKVLIFENVYNKKILKIRKRYLAVKTAFYFYCYITCININVWSLFITTLHCTLYNGATLCY